MGLGWGNEREDCNGRISFWKLSRIHLCLLACHCNSTEGFSFVNAKSHFQTIRWFWSNYIIYFNETWCEPSFYHKVKNHRSDFWYSTPKFSYGPPFASTLGGSKITKIFYSFFLFILFWAFLFGFFVHDKMIVILKKDVYYYLKC